MENFIERLESAGLLTAENIIGTIIVFAIGAFLYNVGKNTKPHDEEAD